MRKEDMDEEVFKRTTFIAKNINDLTPEEQKELDETDWVCMKCGTKHRGLECPECKRIREEMGENIDTYETYIGNCVDCKVKNLMVDIVTHRCLKCWWEKEKEKDG